MGIGTRRQQLHAFVRPFAAAGRRDIGKSVVDRPERPALGTDEAATGPRFNSGERTRGNDPAEEPLADCRGLILVEPD